MFILLNKRFYSISDSIIKPSFIKISINNVEMLTNKNITIIQACLSANNKYTIDLPRFCYHEKLSIAGNCRMCLVEVLKSPKPVVSCAMQVMDGMIIKTNTNLLKKAREGVLEFLLANHPLDCPICDQAGECDLQDQSMIFGGDMGRFYEYKRSVEDKNCGTLIKTVMTRCIHCTRCVRFSKEIAGINTLGVIGRGNKMEIGTYLEKILNTELSGNLIDICPVGALTSKPYAFTARSWELISKESVDIIDSLSPDIKVDIRGTQVMRILPRVSSLNNDGYWLSDNSRFFYDSIIKNRILFPLKNIKTLKKHVSWNNILIYLWEFYYISKFILSKNINFNYKLGELCDAQSLIMLKEFNSYFIGNRNISNIKNINDFRKNYTFKYKKPIISNNKNIIFLIGLNLRVESPIYNIILRQLSLFNKNKIKIISFGSTSNLTYKFWHIGLGMKSLLQVAEGNSYICNIIQSQNLFPILFINSFYMNNKSVSILIDNLFKDINNKYIYGVFNKNIGHITASEINLNFLNNLDIFNNIFSVKDYYKKNVFFNFLLNNYSIKENSSKIFSLFQGSHNSLFLKNINVVLPGLTFLEKISNYINIKAMNRKTQAILPHEKSMRIDWQIIFAILLKYNFMLSKIKLNNLNKYYKINIINLLLKNKFDKQNIIIFIINLFFNNRVDYLFLLNNNNLNKINVNLYNYLILFFNDFNFNVNNFSMCSPLFTLKLYHEIKQSNTYIFNIIYTKNFNKLLNINFNSVTDSFYKLNILTKLSTSLSLTHKNLKLFDTNYI